MSADRLFLFLGAFSALVSVVAGAFGAHAARATLSAQSMAVFDTAVRYQMLHALALCVVAWVHTRWPGSGLPTASGVLFVAGTLLFCGGLYLHSLAGIRGAAVLAPFGGSAFIGGWACLAWLALSAPARIP